MPMPRSVLTDSQILLIALCLTENSVLYPDASSARDSIDSQIRACKSCERMEQKCEVNMQSCEWDGKLWNKRDAARYFGVTTRTIEIWMKAGYLCFFKIGRAVRFRPEDVLNQLKDRNQTE
jgi:excisionase family DNA binding protein